MNGRTHIAAMAVTLILAAGGLVLYHAMEEPVIGGALAACMQAPLFGLLIVRAVTRPRAGSDATGPLTFSSLDLVLGAVVLAAGVVLQVGHGGAALATAVGAYSLGVSGIELICGLVARMQTMADAPLRLTRFAVGCWLIAALVGTILLALPAATHRAVPDYRHNFWRHIARCGFTATSAATLNGGTVFDLAEDVRPFGQAVIYGLMQCGAILLVAIGLIALRPWLSIKLSLRQVLIVWAAVQATSAVVTWSHWRAAQTVGAQAWFGLFHAAAAINNCGFALRQDGVASYLTDSAVFWTVIVLCWAGSIGLIIICDRVGAVWRDRRERKAVDARRRPDVSTTATLDLPSLELHTGTWIICLAAAALWFFETPGFLSDRFTSDRPLYLGVHQRPLREIVTQAPEDAGLRTRLLAMLGERWRAALLMSAAARSAGLHVAPLSEGALSWPSWVLLIVLMATGGAVGAAAGGLRTGTLIVLLYRARLSAAGAAEAPRLAGKIIVMMLTLNAAGVVVMALTPHASMWDAALDGVSSVNGVGWSTGLTPHLTGRGCVAMIPLMLAGRMVPALGWCWIAARMPATGRPARGPKS